MWAQPVRRARPHPLPHRCGAQGPRASSPACTTRAASRWPSASASTGTPWTPGCSAPLQNSSAAAKPLPRAAAELAAAAICFRRGGLPSGRGGTAGRWPCRGAGPHAGLRGDVHRPGWREPFAGAVGCAGGGRHAGGRDLRHRTGPAKGRAQRAGRGCRAGGLRIGSPPDPDDITFLEAEKFASRVDYGGWRPLAFLGRHAAGSAAIAVETALAPCARKASTSRMKQFWRDLPPSRTAAASG